MIENRRPRTMFLCPLLGGMTVALTIDLLDVLVFHADAIKRQALVSAGVDLALGLLLFAAGTLLATGRHGLKLADVVTVGFGAGERCVQVGQVALDDLPVQMRQVAPPSSPASAAPSAKDASPAIWTPVDRDYENLRIDMQALFQHLGIHATLRAT